MRYRVAALPADFVSYDGFLIEDQAGRWYLYDRGDLTAMSPDESVLALTVFEPSQSYDWHDVHELSHLLRVYRPSRPDPTPRSLRTRDAA